MAEAFLEVSAFTIRELTGDRRQLRLSGRALPYRPFEFSGTMRSDITWYPGSPIATLQVLGAAEDETSINGWWKDRFISESADPFFGQAPFAQIDGFPVFTVRELAKIVDDMRRKGQTIEVTWLDLARRGIIKKFSQKWHNAHDLEWDITFQWISQGEGIEDVTVVMQEDDFFDIPSMFTADTEALGEAQASLLERAGAAIAAVTAAINEVVDDIEENVLALEATVSINVQLSLGPLEAVQRVAGIMDFLKRRARNLSFMVSDDAESVLLNSSDSGGTPGRGNTSFGARLRGLKTLRDHRRHSMKIARTAANQQHAMLKRVNPELIRTFAARKDQDLRDVSTEAYGTPDEWQALMRFNRLTTSKLAAGQIIFVPRDPPQGSRC